MATRNDKLVVITTSKNGNVSPSSNKGGVKATILNGDKSGEIEIATDQRTDGKALINISDNNKKIHFSGTFENLTEIIRFVNTCQWLCQAPGASYEECVKQLMKDARELMKG